MTKTDLEPLASLHSVWRLDLPAAYSRVRLAWPAVFAAAGVALLLVYLEFARRIGFGSDGAVIAQQASDWRHGNPLLRGWVLPDITFYTIEIPEFAALEFIRGSVSPAILQIGEALNLTLVVLLAALAAKGQATGREAVIRALVAAGILFAPTPGPNGTLMLGNPDHLATQIPLLVVWIILDRARPRWWVPVTVAALLAWARVNDAIVLLEAEIPLLLVAPINRRGERLVLSPWNSTSSWYDPASHDATFFIAARMQGCTAADEGAWLAAARAAFGPPEHTYSVAGAVVATWPGNLLLAQLAQVPVHRPSAC